MKHLLLFPLLYLLPFLQLLSPRSGPIVEVDIEMANTQNLLTVTENQCFEFREDYISSYKCKSLFEVISALSCEKIPIYSRND